MRPSKRKILAVLALKIGLYSVLMYNLARYFNKQPACFFPLYGLGCVGMGSNHLNNAYIIHEKLVFCM